VNVAVGIVAFVWLSTIAAVGTGAPMWRRRAVPAFPLDAPAPDGVAAPREGGVRGRLPSWVVWTLVVGAVLASVVPNVWSSVSPRVGDQPETGTIPATGATDRGATLADLEAAVQADPTSTDARLALADRYLGLRRLRDATAQYLAVLHLDPSDPHARASIGLVLYLSGRAADGLAAVRGAIKEDPSYPEARLFEAIILYRGLHRDRPARAALRAYLELGVGGPEAVMARTLIARIERAGH
jgi:cytochrome c-type biogenesis protein CcmH/NrfG